jgi:hypothetical protein
MILIQIATALAIGFYVVLSKDAQPERSDATPRASFQHPADHLDRDDLSERLAIRDYILLTDEGARKTPEAGGLGWLHSAFRISAT